jgi:hypothetical protein
MVAHMPMLFKTDHGFSKTSTSILNTGPKDAKEMACVIDFTVNPR